MVEACAEVVGLLGGVLEFGRECGVYVEWGDWDVAWEWGGVSGGVRDVLGELGVSCGECVAVV